jgi:hypothetical protein
MSTTNPMPSAPFPIPSSQFRTPSSPLPIPNSALPKPGPGRPRALDNLKIHKILNLVFCGFSLEQAAQHIGCAASTIRREARRNPDFNKELTKLLLDSELFALNGAAHTHWRAGRYLLERMAAQRTREQKGQPLTPRRLRRFTAAITAALETEIKDEAECQRLTARLIGVLRETNRNLAKRSSMELRRQTRRDANKNKRTENESPALDQTARQNAARNDTPGELAAMSTSAYGKITHYSSFAEATRAAPNIGEQPSGGVQQ